MSHEEYLARLLNLLGRVPRISAPVGHHRLEALWGTASKTEREVMLAEARWLLEHLDREFAPVAD